MTLFSLGSGTPNLSLFSSLLVLIIILLLLLLTELYYLFLNRGIKKLKECLHPDALKQKLPRFLQKCTQSFESDRRYRNDLRYLRVWLQLVNFRARLFPFLCFCLIYWFLDWFIR
jgi:hypothetical protein